jgi:hypothetical protein
MSLNNKLKLLMKNFTFLVFIFLCLNGISQTVIPQKGTGSKFSLTCANVYFEIDSAVGARISSLKLNNNELLYTYNASDMDGSTFWPSPQSVWNWPPPVNLDNKKYKSEITGNKIKFTGMTDTKTNLRFYKTMYANTADTSIIIDYCIKNEKATSQKWAPWEVTRVLGKGLTVFTLGEGSVTGSMVSFTEEQNGYIWYDQDIHTATSSKYKFFSDSEGWLAHVIDGDMLFIKKFENITKSQAAPGEAEVEIYTATGNTYTELENQGAYSSIASKDSVTWSVKWYARLLPASVDVSVGSSILTNYIESVLMREAPNNVTKIKNNIISKIYPNPVSTLLTIETGFNPGNETIMRIIDLQGRIVLSHSINQTKVQINVENLNQGIYIYDLKQGTKTLSKGQITIKH